MFYGVLLFLFVVVCLMLIGIILLQSSQSGGMGTAMGGQAMNTAFGGQGADKLLVRITSGLAICFMSIAIVIGWMGHPESVAISPDNPTLSRNKTNSTATIEVPADMPVLPVNTESDDSGTNQ